MSFADISNASTTGRPGYDAAPRSVTAFFDTSEAAETARRDLIQAGVPTDDIHLAGGEAAAPAVEPHEHGFWHALREFFMPEEDRFGYAEGLRRGGYTVAVRTDEAAYDAVLAILDRDGAVDMDERESSWRDEGWAPAGNRVGDRSDLAYASASASTAGFGASAADAFPLPDDTTPVASSSVAQSAPMVGAAPASADRSAGWGPAAAPSSAARATPDAAYIEAAPGLAANDRTGTAAVGSGPGPAAGPDQALPMLEEQLKVGKRDVSHGRIRVRSYVVETPVREQVDLRQESVSVERRPVDRPAAGSDADFQDRVIEAEETAEEAVVSKEARVTEEIALHKTVAQRTETVSDTVRRTEVEVERDRGSATDAPAAPSPERKT